MLLKTPAVFERTVASATFELTWTVIVQTADAPETRLLGAHETVRRREDCAASRPSRVGHGRRNREVEILRYPDLNHRYADGPHRGNRPIGKERAARQHH